jgi:hypothetical protein
MGHSKRIPSVVTSPSYKMGDLSREEIIDDYIETISSQDTKKMVDYFIRNIIPFLPNGSAKMPAYYCIRYGAQFLADSQKYGTEQATENLAKTFVRDQVMMSAMGYICDSAEEHVLQSGASKSLAMFSEVALEETMRTIWIKGVDAL